MRILQVLPTLSAGGAEGFIANLGVSLADEGAEVRVYLLAGVRGERGRVLAHRLEDADVGVVGSAPRSVRSLGNVTGLHALIRAWKPDIVQANLYAGSVACAVVRTLGPCRASRYARRLTSTIQAGSRPPWIVRSLDRFFDLTIANSAAVATSYTEYMEHRGRSRLVTVPNGGLLANHSTSPDERREARRALGLPADGYVVTHIGGMAARKQRGGGLEVAPKAHDTVLRAFGHAFSDEKDCFLLLVGTGPLKPHVERLADTLDLAGRVRFLGEVPEPWPVLQAADVFFFPSRYEGLPNVLPEAASTGLPIIASDIPEIRALKADRSWLLRPVDGVAGFAEALQDVRSHLVRYHEQAAAAAVGFRERFSMATCARKYLAAYETVLGG